MPTTLSGLLHLLWLPVASFFAGVLNAVAGGGSFLSLPALLAAAASTGVGAVAAQATNTVALYPGQITGLIAMRKKIAGFGWGALPISIAAGLGGWLGGFLLLRTPNHQFKILLPWLILFGSVMFVISIPLGDWIAKRSGGRRYETWLLIGMLVVSIYVGYFGAGGGFLVMALFGLCGVTNIHEINALKILTAAVSLGIPTVSFILARRVEWRFCVEMAVLAALGGYLAARFSTRVNHKIMRWTVAGIGLLTAIYFFVQS
jgi:uncharacterized membrane protein YfcA